MFCCSLNYITSVNQDVKHGKRELWVENLEKENRIKGAQEYDFGIHVPNPNWTWIPGSGKIDRNHRPIVRVEDSESRCITVVKQEILEKDKMLMKVSGEPKKVLFYDGKWKEEEIKYFKFEDGKLNLHVGKKKIWSLHYGFTFDDFPNKPGARTHVMVNHTWRPCRILQKLGTGIQVVLDRQDIPMCLQPSPAIVIMDEAHRRLLLPNKSEVRKHKHSDPEPGGLPWARALSRTERQPITSHMNKWKCVRCDKSHHWRKDEYPMALDIQRGRYMPLRKCDRDCTWGFPKLAKCKLVSELCQIISGVQDAVPQLLPVTCSIVGEYVCDSKRDTLFVQLLLNVTALEYGIYLEERKEPRKYFLKGNWDDASAFAKIASTIKKKTFGSGIREYRDLWLPEIPLLGGQHEHEMNMRVGLKLRTKLYSYQKRTILWATTLERKIADKHRFVIGANDLMIGPPHFASRYLYDYSEDGFMRFDSCASRYVSYHGGMICDETGLGKTLTAIGLVAAGTARDIREAPHGHSYKYDTHLTLVVCPSHLCSQWKEQIEKHSNLKVMLVTTKPQHNAKPTKYFDHDIVITSEKFLTGAHYTKLLKDEHKIRKQPPAPSAQSFGSVVDTMWNSEPQGIFSEPPRGGGSRKQYMLFTDIKWKRIILDEGHEFIITPIPKSEFLRKQALTKPNFKKIMETVNRLESHANWYLTATPFPSVEHGAAVAQFLKINLSLPNGNPPQRMNIEDYNILMNRPQGYVFHQVMHGYLFSRNTKLNIGEENHLPQELQSEQIIEFHPIERALYKMTVEHKMHNWEKIARKICAQVHDVWEFGGYGSSQTLQDLLRNTIRRRTDLLHETNASIWELENRMNRPHFYERRESIILQKEKCEIKLGKYSRDLEILQDPKLREAIEKWNKEMSDRGSVYRNTPTLGTKISAFLQWTIDTLKDERNRIVIFSQYQYTLTTCERLLKRSDIKTVWCKGNVHMRQKALAAFQSEDWDQKSARILMLSLVQAAAGANLTKATHICLLDPVAGTEEAAYTTEVQAVGRAVRQAMDNDRPCRIVRFIVKDTIEHELYLRNKKRCEETSGSADSKQNEREEDVFAAMLGEAGFDGR